MKDQQYLRPESLAETLEILARFGSGARLLAGGTDVMVRIQKLHLQPEVIVDLKRVADISDAITVDPDGISVGSRVILADLIRRQVIRDRFPALAEAAATVGSVQIRNRATLTGNICNASPAADTVPPLLVHEASVVVAGQGGTRTVALEGFFVSPGKTQCGPDELVVSVRIPFGGTRAVEPAGTAFDRLTRRHGVDLATINMACRVTKSGAVTFAFGAVGPTPIVVRATLADRANERDVEQMLRALIAKTRPISDVRSSAKYRSAMLLAVGRRVLGAAENRLAAAMKSE